MKTELNSMSEVQSFFDPRHVYKNLKRPKTWIAALVSVVVLNVMDTLIKSDFYRPEIVVLKDPKTKKLTITCKFSNHKRSYAMWFVADPSKNPYALTDRLFKEWFGISKHKVMNIKRKQIGHQVDIDPLTRTLLGMFDDYLTDTKSQEPLKIVTSQLDDIDKDVCVHTKHGTTWYIGGNKPIFGRSSFVSAGFAYQIK